MRKTAVLLFASMAFAAAADVHNLESHLFRYDFSRGAKNFVGSEVQVSDPMNSAVSYKPAEGPNGPGSAVQPGTTYGSNTIGGSAAKGVSILSNDWTLAVCMRLGSNEKGYLYSIGRANDTYSKCIFFASSSTPGKMWVGTARRKNPSKGSDDRQMAAEWELTGLGDTQSGFHTIAAAHSAGGKVSIYFDGAYVREIDTVVNATNCVFKNGIQFCQAHGGAGFLEADGYSSSQYNDEVAFYDLRLYAGRFSQSDAEAYASLFPCTHPFRPGAYVEAYGCSSLDTGVRPSASIRYLVDFQYLDLAGKQRIFGTGSSGADGVSGEGVFADLYINGTADSGGQFARSLHGPYVSGSTWMSLNVTADRLRRKFDLDGFNATSRLYNADGTPAGGQSNVQIRNLPGAADAANARSTRLFATEYGMSGLQGNSTARIYSFKAFRDGSMEAFFAPGTNTAGEAGFIDVLTGEFKGDEVADPAKPLRFFNGIGCAGDYKYEDSVLYAKLYATVNDADLGMVRIADGSSAASAEGWIPHGGTLALEAVPAVDTCTFSSWKGDTWAIAPGYTATNARIEVSSDTAIQLQGQFEAGGDQVIFY